jgi:tripartite-type tricarboxylate transporter receptor subunit TctC
MKIFKELLAGACLMVFAGSIAAQDYPNRPVKIIVPLAAGGGVDIVTRAVAARLSEQMKQTFLVENRPGAFTNIGSEAAAKSPPDGYTLLMASPANTVNGSLFTNLPYDVLRDFVGVSQIAYAPLVMVVNPSFSAKTVPELIALAKASPGQLSYASSGNGSSQHLAGELFRGATNVDLIHVSYKGGAPALIDLLGGRTTFMFNNTLEVLPHLKNGKLRAIAVTSPKRTHVLPDVPTVAESGFPGFETTVWWGLLAPAGTPKDIVARLSEEVARAMQTPELQARFKDMGAEIVASNPEQFARFLKADVEKWAATIKSAGIRPVE